MSNCTVILEEEKRRRDGFPRCVKCPGVLRNLSHPRKHHLKQVEQFLTEGRVIGERASHDFSWLRTVNCSDSPHPQPRARLLSSPLRGEGKGEGSLERNLRKPSCNLC